MSTRWTDFRDCWLIPYVAARLPQRSAARWVRAWIRVSNAYRAQAENAQTAMQRAQWLISQREAFQTQFRALLALGHADVFRLERVAPPSNHRTPQSAPGQLVVSFHWGSASLDLHAWAQQHGPIHFVSAPLEKEENARSSLRRRFAQRSVRAMQQAFGAPLIFTDSSAREAITAALRAGRNVCVLIDVPPHLTGRTIATTVCGRAFQLPLGISEIAHQTQAPVTLLRARPHSGNGSRKTHWRTIGVMPTPIALAEHSAQALTDALNDTPAAWHMWPHVDDFCAPKREDELRRSSQR